MNPRRTYSIIVALSALSLLLLCTQVSQVGEGPGGGGTGSEVVGVVYAPDLSGASGAVVKIVGANNDPRTSTGFDTTITADSEGTYRIDGLVAGTYNILSQKDSLRAFSQNVGVSDSGVQDTLRDTLRLPGSVSGRVQLQPGDPVSSVFILFLGTGVFCVPDGVTGAFAATDLAPGSYAVRILSTIDTYVPLDTTFRIAAGTNLTLASPIVLRYTGIPVPQNLAILYDSLQQIATLAWSKPVTGRPVAGYTVYRKGSDSANFSQIKTGVSDTVFRDSNGVQGQTYEYKVAAIDTSGTEGVKSAPANVTFVGAFTFIKDIGDSGAGYGHLLMAADVAYDQDGNLWVVDNGRNKVLKYGADGNFLLEWGVEGSGVGQLMSPTGIDIDKEGNIYIADSRTSRVQKFDMTGNCLLQIDSIGSQPLWDVSVDDSGNMFVFSKDTLGTGAIRKCDTQDAGFVEWLTQAQWLERAIFTKNGRLYVCGQMSVTGQPFDNNFIEVHSSEGDIIQTLNIRRPGEYGAITVRDLDVDSRGQLYAAESESGTIRVFDSQGCSIALFGRKTFLSSIGGIACSTNSEIAISDGTMIHLYRLP